MAEVLQKLIRLMPRWPRRRYNVFCGTNTWGECRRLAWRCVSGGGDPSDVAAYERAFGARIGSADAVSFGAGRMALYALLEAMGVGPGDEVIIPAYTCVVVPNAVLYRGARPVYVDIEPRFFNVAVERVEAAITERTRVIIAQHTFGVPCDIAALLSIAGRHGIPVLEDCGHALGASYMGRPVGSLAHGAFFTTDHTKVINTYLGGVATTPDAALGARLREIQARAGGLSASDDARMAAALLAEFAMYSPRLLWIGSPVMAILGKLGLFFSWRDELSTSRPTGYPYPAKFSPILAQTGLDQLAVLDSNLEHRRAVARLLESEVGWTGLVGRELDEPAWLRYSFLVKDRAAFVKRFSHRFDLAPWFTSVTHGRWSDFAEVGYEPGQCPVAERVAGHVVNFPTHSRIPVEMLAAELREHGPWIREQILRLDDAADAG